MGAAWKETLKKSPFIHALGKEIKHRLQDIAAIPDFLAERRIRREGPIRVGFFCQYIPAWTKVASIYEILKADPRFEPYLLCLPSGIMDGKLNDPDSLENDTYQYFLAQGYPEAINTLTGKAQWLDLKEMDLSYIFYPRPYSPLVPACYAPARVRRYSRVCILMYGMALTEQIAQVTLNRGFMRNVYYYFAETSFARKLNKRTNWFLHWLGLQKTLCLGVPVLENLAKQRNTPSPSWDFSKNDFRAIWTPRWTTDKAEGGSNFFTFYESLPDYAQQHPDMDFLFRPHPMTFSHFIETGEMTPQQVEAFKTRCRELPNVELDTQSQYEATLWGSSVMISDLSSIMPEYFITGKPLIFCAANMELKLAGYAQKMVDEGCYVVHTPQELFACLDQLRKGIDPLAPARQQLIRELFGSSSEGASQRIADALAAQRKRS